MKKKNRNEAPSNIPQKQGWRMVFEILGMLVWTAVSVIASQFAMGYLMVFLFGADVFDRTIGMAIFSALSYVLALIFVIWLPSKIAEKRKDKNNTEKPHPMTISREELGLEDLPTWTDIGLAPVGFIAQLLLAMGLTAIFSQFAWFDASEVQDVGFNSLLLGTDRLVAFLTLVVIVPVAEEVIFRGWLYGKLRTITSVRTTNVVSITISALLVSILFAIVHGQWNVGVNVFALSLVACMLREITGTIYAGILVHMIKNGVAFYLLYVMGFGG